MVLQNVILYNTQHAASPVPEMAGDASYMIAGFLVPLELASLWQRWIVGGEVELEHSIGGIRAEKRQNEVDLIHSASYPLF